MIYTVICEFWNKSCDIIGTFSTEIKARESIINFLHTQVNIQTIFTIKIFKSNIDDTNDNDILKEFNYDEIENIIKR